MYILGLWSLCLQTVSFFIFVVFISVNQFIDKGAWIQNTPFSTHPTPIGTLQMLENSNLMICITI